MCCSLDSSVVMFEVQGVYSREGLLGSKRPDKSNQEMMSSEQNGHAKAQNSQTRLLTMTVIGEIREREPHIAPTTVGSVTYPWRNAKHARSILTAIK